MWHPFVQQILKNTFRHNLLEYITLRLDSTNEAEQWYVGTIIFIVLLYTRHVSTYEGWNFNSGNYLFTTDTK